MLRILLHLQNLYENMAFDRNISYTEIGITERTMRDAEHVHCDKDIAELLDNFMCIYKR